MLIPSRNYTLKLFILYTLDKMRERLDYNVSQVEAI